MHDLALTTDQSQFTYGLDDPLPDEVLLGKGIVLKVRGWCYSNQSRLRRLDIVAGRAVMPVPNHSWGRPDIFAEQCPANDQSGNSLMSGFEGFLPFDFATPEGEMVFTLRATLQAGEVIERPLGTIRFLSGYGALPTPATWHEEGPRVAICMTTFASPVELFKAQIASIQQQTYRNWVCIINDDNTNNEHYDRIRFLVKNDKRFLLFQNTKRLNFYENFQQVLRRTPANADFVALSDQDDVWHPNKLRMLLDGFRPGIQLVYSDARVVDEAGQSRSETFWTTRQNNHTDLATLMVANTITGAASMIRATLLPEVLPFPEQVGSAFHDHWIGLVALLKGGIGYVNSPLYDYIQHDSGVIGHRYNKWPGAFSAIRHILRVAPHMHRMATAATMVLKQSQEDYKFVQQKVMLARTLLLRNPDLSSGHLATLHRFARFETSLAAAWNEKLAAVRARRPTLNLEGMLVSAIIGTRIRNYALRYKQSDFLHRQINNPGGRLLDAVIALRKPSARKIRAVANLPGGSATIEAEEYTGNIPVLEFGTTKWIYRNILPLTLDISADYPKRVNILLATINFSYVFGGYIGMFNLALRLRREGYCVRIILHESTDWNTEDWRRQIRAYPGITTLFDDVEVILRWDRTVPVEVSPRDRFIATNCWAAHIAHRTVQHFEDKRFLFMAQEYEPYFMAMNSISALFQQAYDLPQMTLFSTELLQDFFRRERLGIYARPNAEANAMVFSNAIQKFHPTRDQLARKQRRLLFYARWEEHAARNLFELGMMALAALVRDPRVDLTGWSFHGIGSLGGNMLELAEGIPLELVAKTSLQEYIKLMSTFDVGLSLMLTPHPSLVPIEMASAGMWTVTNTFANKTAERLKAISSNLIGVPPTVEAIRDGLVEAMARVDDIDGRLAGARVSWPTEWDQAFPAESIQRIQTFLGEPG